MCLLYVTSSDDSSEWQCIITAAGCFTSKRIFFMGGGLTVVNPNLEGTFLIFLNLFLSCPCTVPYINNISVLLLIVHMNG